MTDVCKMMGEVRRLSAGGEEGAAEGENWCHALNILRSRRELSDDRTCVFGCWYLSRSERHCDL